MLQVGNVGQELSLFVIKQTTFRRKIIQRFITFDSELFRALVSFTYNQYTHVPGNNVMANKTHHQQKLQKFVLEFKCWY